MNLEIKYIIRNGMAIIRNGYNKEVAYGIG